MPMPSLIQKVPTLNSGWEWGNGAQAAAPHLVPVLQPSSQSPWQPQPAPQRCCWGDAELCQRRGSKLPPNVLVPQLPTPSSL